MQLVSNNNKTMKNHEQILKEQADQYGWLLTTHSGYELKAFLLEAMNKSAKQAFNAAKEYKEPYWLREHKYEKADDYLTALSRINT